MVSCHVLCYMALKKEKLQKTYWENNRLILKFKEYSFRMQCADFIEGVWEVSCPHSETVIECGVYVINTYEDVYTLGKDLDKFLEKLPVGV